GGRRGGRLRPKRRDRSGSPPARGRAWWSGWPRSPEGRWEGRGRTRPPRIHRPARRTRPLSPGAPTSVPVVVSPDGLRLQAGGAPASIANGPQRSGTAPARTSGRGEDEPIV